MSECAWIDAGGVALRYRTEGVEGPVVLLLHEAGGLLESWSAVMGSLAKKARLLAFDMRGSGLSEKILGEISLDQLADDAIALVAALGVKERVVVCGVALGGAISICVAARYPERVAGLVAFGPTAQLSPERIGSTLAAALALEEKGPRARLGDGEIIYPSALRNDHEAFSQWRLRTLGVDGRSEAAVRRMICTIDLQPSLPRISCPALFVAGSLDRVRAPHDIAAMARQAPNAEFIELRTGHFAPLQTPQLVAGVIEHFLTERLGAVDAGDAARASQPPRTA